MSPSIAPRLHEPITLDVTSTTRPGGREAASLVVDIDGWEHSLESKRSGRVCCIG